MSVVAQCMLQVGAVYLSPRGRLCMLLPPPAHGPGSDGGSVQFAYLRRDGQRSVEDGFNLSPPVARRIMTLMAGAEAGRA